jgi:hypothetical protein
MHCGMLQTFIRARFDTAIRVFFRGRVHAFVEVPALRQQLAVLKRERP